MNKLRYIKKLLQSGFRKCWLCKHSKLIRVYGSDKLLVCREPSIFKNSEDVCWFICHERGCKLWKYDDD